MSTATGTSRVEILPRHLYLTAENGIPFAVSFVARGTDNPHNRHRVSETHSLLEFYDARYVAGGFTTVGQYVSGYRVTTILGTDGSGPGIGALDLDSAVDDWTIDDATMQIVRSWALAVSRSI